MVNSLGGGGEGDPIMHEMEATVKSSKSETTL